MTDLINDLRNLNVLVLHPRDADADDLIQQVNRIGCSVEALWPLPENLPVGVDLIFVEVKESVSPELTRLLSNNVMTRPTVIGIIGYENPSVLQGMLDLSVQTVLSKPLRAFGVMGSMLMARRIWHEKREDLRNIDKIKLKLENIQAIVEAKFILMRHHGINDKDAYNVIRSHAMARRTSTRDIAHAIINADGLLNNFQIKK